MHFVTQKKLVSELDGLGRAMPFTFGAFFLASLTMIGAPPAAGFITKWDLLIGALDANQVGILLVLITSTILNAAYFLPFHLFFDNNFTVKNGYKQ